MVVGDKAQEEVASPTTGSFQDAIADLPIPDVEAQRPRPITAPSSGWRPSLRRARSNISKTQEKEEQQQQQGADYETDLVNILDLVGMIFNLTLTMVMRLTSPTFTRPRSLDATNSDERTKLTNRPSYSVYGTVDR